MSQIEHLHILLNKQERLVFYAGETMSGKVYLKVREGFKIRSVKLVVRGDSRVQWVETNGTGKRRKRDTYSATEMYLNHEELLVYKLPDSPELILQPGEYTFSFKVTLPTMLPSSFETTNARIHYSARVTIDVPWSVDKFTHVSFTVINMLDLNYLPFLRHPFDCTGAKQVGCGPFKQNPIDVKFSTNQTAFVSGEFIRFSVEINNRTRKPLKEINVQLKQIIRLHAEEQRTDKYKIKSRENELGKLKCLLKFKSNSVEKWEGSLQVPAVCPSLKGICRIIEVDYLLALNLKAGLFTLVKEFTIPLTIGTVPYRNIADANPVFSFDPGPLKGPTPSGSTWTLGGEKSEAIESNYLSYTPVYPYYKDLIKTP